MKKVILFTILLVSLKASAQTYYYTHTRYTYGPYYFSTALNFIGDILEEKRRKEERERMAQKMRERIKEIETYYKEQESYPNKISDGWHEVTLIGGDEYIDERKVLIEDGKIKRIFWDNWLEEDLSFAGPINNAKAGIRIKGGSGPMEGMLNMYFMNDLVDGNNIVDPPVTPGTVTFWTDNKKFDKYFVMFEEMELGPFNQKQDAMAPPTCGSNEAINIIYKPGIYRFKGYTKDYYGNPQIKCEGTVQINSGECSDVRINKAKKLRK